MIVLIMAIENHDDREKAAEIYRLYSTTMFKIAKGILHDAHLAEDAVSEAFVRIIDNLEKINLSDRNKTKGFVVIIVRHIAIDMLRRQKRFVPLDDHSDYTECREPVLSSLASDEACSKIADALAKLNRNYSDILYLKIVFNCSNDEIAKILGISRDNVNVRLHRARNALKQQLMKENDLYDRKGKK